ncbi:MAG TPA: thioredoxin [Verrucomicrobiota bacterium]|nr:thioredoxin [Verrucomicrobiota bacterium]
MTSNNIINLTSDNFETEVIKSNIPVVVDFWADWCGPCKMLAPVLDELANEYVGKVKICKLNVDDCPEIANNYGISSIPTILFFKEGNVVGQSVGVKPKTVLKASLDKLI